MNMNFYGVVFNKCIFDKNQAPIRTHMLAKLHPLWFNIYLIAIQWGLAAVKGDMRNPINVKGTQNLL